MSTDPGSLREPWPGQGSVTGQNRVVDRKRRVAITVEQCWHQVPGGTANAALATIAALSDRPDLELIGVAARHRNPPSAAFQPTISIAHLPLPRLALYESWHALGWPRVERATGAIDVVHATAIAVPPSDAPLVMTINDLAFLTHPGQATRHGNRFFRRGTELARRHARLVLVPSEATASECRSAGFDPERLRLVPYGVEAQPVSDADAAAFRARHGLARPYVLFVGTVEPRKNLAAVVGGMAALAGRGIDLVLVGPDGWNEDLRARLAPLEGTGTEVHRLGFLPADEVAAAYAGCAAFCYPSLREGFGLPVLEAMAQGAPVVTSAGTATAEVAGDAGLLVDPHDHGQVGQALVRLVDDQALAADLRDRGRRRAATYTWERTAALTAAAYAEVSP